MDPKETGWDGKACAYLAADKNEWLAVVNTIMNLMVPLMGQFSN
jgi:hypothetical protein